MKFKDWFNQKRKTILISIIVGIIILVIGYLWSYFIMHPGFLDNFWKTSP